MDYSWGMIERIQRTFTRWRLKIRAAIMRINARIRR